METSEQSAAREAAGSAPTTYSVVVPIFNERDSIEELYARIVAVMTREARPFEIVFVSDGSRDGSDELLEQIAQADARVVYLRLRRNFGQATALQAGFDHAGGDVFICMDGDLQHDPDEIPLFLAKIDEASTSSLAASRPTTWSAGACRRAWRTGCWRRRRASRCTTSTRTTSRRLPARSPAGRAHLRRHAPLHSGDLRAARGDDRRSARLQRAARVRHQQLRHRADLPRGDGHPDDALHD